MGKIMQIFLNRANTEMECTAKQSRNISRGSWKQHVPEGFIERGMKRLRRLRPPTIGPVAAQHVASLRAPATVDNVQTLPAHESKHLAQRCLADAGVTHKQRGLAVLHAPACRSAVTEYCGVM